MLLFVSQSELMSVNDCKMVAGMYTIIQHQVSKLLERGINGMYVAWNAAASGILGGWAVATGMIAGVAGALLTAGAGKLASYAKDCRDDVDSHGNTGTARITLTESRWSSKYDNKW